MSSEKPLLLLVDDEPHVTHIVSRKLRSLGYETLVARDGEEALAMAENRTPDLVITDLQMPYLNGLELAERLCSDPATASVPVILLTARGYLLEEAEQTRTNIVRTLAKPFSVTGLVGHVGDVLAGGSGAQLGEAA